MSTKAEFDVMVQYPFLALLRRELVSHLRTRRMFFGMLSLSVVCAWIVIGQWPYGDQFVWRTLVRKSESLLGTFAGLALTCGPIIVSAIAANALVSERENESWDLLQLSLISRMGIVAGKLLGPVAIFALTLAVCAPIFAALLFLAGLDFVHAGQCLILIGATSITCSAIALACSVRATRTVTATTVAFFCVAVFLGLDVIALVVVVGFFDEVLNLTVSGGYFPSLYIASPYYLLGQILSAATPAWIELGLHLSFQGVLLVGSVGFAAWGIGRGELPMNDVDRVRRRWLGRGTRTAPAAPRPKRRPIPDRSNPVFLRELYWGSPFSTRRARRTAAVLFAAAFLLSCAMAYTASTTNSTDAETVIGIVSAFLAGAIGCLYVPVACAGAYTKEHAIANFDLLRGTLMTPKEIVWGKFQAALVLSLAVWCACFLANLPVNLMYVFRSEGVLYLVFGYGSLLAALVEGAAAGLLVSFYSRRGGAAIVGSYALIFMVYFGFFLVFVIVSEAIGSGPSVRDLSMQIFLVTSPVLSYFWGLFDALDNQNRYRVAHWLVSLLVAAGFAFGTQIWMIGKFNARIEQIAGH